MQLNLEQNKRLLEPEERRRPYQILITPHRVEQHSVGWIDWYGQADDVMPVGVWTRKGKE